MKDNHGCVDGCAGGVSPDDHVDGCVDGDQEQDGNDSSGQQPRPVDIVEDVGGVQPQLSDGEVKMRGGHIILEQY